MQNIVIPEILAPAGGREQFFAALHSGADGVYLGMKKFNARARAENFSREDLAELVPLARHHGMKVLVTLNILIKEDELSQVVEQLIDLERLMVDAVIIQDVGVLSLVQRYAPRLRVHGSTQMAIHNISGVIQAQKMGLSRVVLAREITSTELVRMRRYLEEWSQKTGQNPIEIEVFCHGSLCYSYSGLCFFSGSEDSRSGNRGECAYTCRKPYKIVSEKGQGFLFSMRDLDTSSHLDQLIKAGVHTLKIEGRKKDAQYVTSTVNLYRQRMNQIFGTDTGRKSGVKSEDLRAQIAEHVDLSFQRARTTFFLNGRYHENVIDLDHASHQGVEVGRVEKVEFKGDTCTIELVTKKTLSRFDGLRIISQRMKDGGDRGYSWDEYLRRYHNKHLEFSLRDYKILDRSGPWGKAETDGTNAFVFEIPAGCRLKISFTLGQNTSKSSPGVQVGDRLFKVRSQQFKDQVSTLSHPPRDHRPRAFYRIDLHLDFLPHGNASVIESAQKPMEINGVVRASLWGEEWALIPFSLPCTQAQATSQLAQDLENELRIFGDWGLEVMDFSIKNLPRELFVKRSDIKRLKRTLGPKISERYQKWLEMRMQKFLQDRQGAVSISNSTGPVSEGELSHGTLPPFVLKTDDLNLIDAIEEIQQEIVVPQLGRKRIKELIFEPKKGRLDQVKPEFFLGRLEPLKRLGILWRLALPVVIRGWDEPLVKLWTTAALNDGCRRFEVGNLGALEFLHQLALELGIDPTTLDVHGDFTLYALNSEATIYLKGLGLKGVSLSIEDDVPNISSQLQQLARRNILGPEFAVSLIAYKDIPLFIAEACGLTALHGGCPTAKVCGYRTLEVENAEKERFFVAHETCKSIVYSAEAMSITHHLDRFFNSTKGDSSFKFVNQIRLDFLTRPYQPQEFKKICMAAFQAKYLSQTHEANFSRRLL
jgi:putative protease